LQTFAQGISVILFATLAGASIVAISVVADIWSKQATKDTIYEAVNRYLGMGYFITSFVVFILGIVLTLVLDSIGVNFVKSLVFEIINITIRGLTLLAGIILLFGGVDALIRHFMKRKFRFFPATDKITPWLVERIIPTPKDNFKVEKSETQNQIKVKNIDLKDAGKLLSDQLKTAFITILLLLWLTTLNVTVHRGSALPWLIASVLLFIWLLLSYRKKKLRCPILRWLLPFAAVGVFWILYFLSGVSLSPNFIHVFVAILLLWTLILVLALLSSMAKITSGGKLEKAIIQLALWGDAASWPLTIGVLAISILLGWTRLWNAGIKDWWMDPLLYWGMLVLIVVIITSTRRTESR